MFIMWLKSPCYLYSLTLLKTWSSSLLLVLWQWASYTNKQTNTTLFCYNLKWLRWHRENIPFQKGGCQRNVRDHKKARWKHSKAHTKSCSSTSCSNYGAYVLPWTWVTLSLWPWDIASLSGRLYLVSAGVINTLFTIPISSISWSLCAF